jgi:hypothetical protein
LGTVVDPSGNVIVGASVILIHEGTGDQRSLSTDVTGSFVFPSLLPGTYTVRVESQGFQRFEKRGKALSAAERLSLGSIQLTIGSLAETVTVNAQGTTVQTASAEPSALLTTEQLDTVAQRGRNIPSMLQMLPGVSQIGQLETVHGSQRTTGSTVPHIGGIRGALQTMTLDGLEGMDTGDSDSFTTNASPDAVEEVKVLLNNYQAEYGRSGGAVINIITKSGTKDFSFCKFAAVILIAWIQLVSTGRVAWLAQGAPRTDPPAGAAWTPPAPRRRAQGSLPGLSSRL